VWLLIILGFFILFIYLVFSKLVLLLSFPTNVDVNVEYKYNLKFPAVTICNQNMYR